ncbi:hypothetical protein [Kitasatospora griseola]|uniref:hypothetical protein n=1 Tax=Kitasatospora griseola TaxID=2064 RepID=UPI0037F53647
MSVRRRTRLAVLAATAVLGATVPVLGGATSAWACGDDQPAASASASAPASAPAASPTPAADPKPGIGVFDQNAGTITAGGAPVEFGVEVHNGGTETLKGIHPFPTFFNESGDLDGTLHAADLSLEVMHQGAWKTIALKPGCDPTLRGDYSFLDTDLAPGRATRFLFRLSVTSHSTAAQKQVDVRVGVQQPYQNFVQEHPHFTLPIVHPAAPGTPAPGATTKAPTTPAATPSAPSTPAQTPTARNTTAPVVVPAALTSSTVPSPTAVPVGTGNLASTGGGAADMPLLIGGTALVLLGAGAVTFAARRRAAGHRG